MKDINTIVQYAENALTAITSHLWINTALKKNSTISIPSQYVHSICNRSPFFSRLITAASTDPFDLFHTTVIYSFHNVLHPLHSHTLSVPCSSLAFVPLSVACIPSKSSSTHKPNSNPSSSRSSISSGIHFHQSHVINSGVSDY